MPAAWRLATNNLSGRRNRSLLLIAAVTLSASLIAAVACAMASLDRALLERAKATLGAADLRVQHVGGAPIDPGVVELVRRWPEVRLAVPRMREAVALRNPAATGSRDPAAPPEATVFIFGIDPALEPEVRAFTFIAGRQIARDGEVVLDERAARFLAASVGSRVEVVRFGEPLILEVVGVVACPPLGAMIEREEGFATVPTVCSIIGLKARFSEIDILLRQGLDPVEVQQSRRPPPVTQGAPAPGSTARPGVADFLRSRFLSKAPEGSAASRDAKAAAPNDPDPLAASPAATPSSAPAAAPDALPRGLVIQATERVTSGLQKNMESNKIGLILASTLAFVGASFIILTGMTTAVTERARELAILRCIGAKRAQLGAAQVLVGLIIGVAGAALGTPLGVAFAYALVLLFPEQLPGGFGMSWLGAALASMAAIGAGLAGAAWPAAVAAKSSPLEGLSLRSRPVARKWIWVCAAAGPLLLGTHLLIVRLLSADDGMFWVYVTVGLPALMAGYFVLSVPLTLGLASLVADPLARVLRLPRHLLAPSITGTPFRHGFTAGAMMLGLAIMVAIWTNGRAVMRDWLDALALPDAFIYGTGFRPEVHDRIKALPEVATTCAITRQTVELEDHLRQGIKGLAKFNTYFFGFEPRPFFQMTRVVWEQGDPATAIPRLEQGGAILVERSFTVSRGISVGQTIFIRHNDREYPFEVVGVISSPGLDIASKFLEVGEQFVENAVNSVFGSRDDMVRLFGNDAINFVQIGFKPGADGREGLRKAREAAGGGVLIAVLATDMKDRIREVISGSLLVFSLVGVAAMLVACLGVANVIVAGIQARQFEFGVLRALGAQRGLLGRLVLGEAILIAAAACILGTFMGLQGAFGGLQVYRALLGLSLSLPVHVPAIAIGCAAVFAITLGAAVPSAARLVRKPPRELLAAMKG